MRAWTLILSHSCCPFGGSESQLGFESGGLELNGPIRRGGKAGLNRGISDFDNYNLNAHRRCSNMSRMDVPGYVRHVIIISLMFSIACCFVVWLRLGLGLGLDLVSGW